MKVLVSFQAEIDVTALIDHLNDEAQTKYEHSKLGAMDAIQEAIYTNFFGGLQYDGIECSAVDDSIRIEVMEE